jgi:hypothetical protein
MVAVIHAVRSQDNRYQYELTYRWSDGPICGWILLNPSLEEVSADRDFKHVKIGATGHRCANLAAAWGYSGVVIRNRFAFRATYPGDLLRVEDPYGPENLRYLSRAKEDPITVVAWGGSSVVDLAPELPGSYPRMCIGKNRNGSPRHVLHAATVEQPTPWP